MTYFNMGHWLVCQVLDNSCRIINQLFFSMLCTYTGEEEKVICYDCMRESGMFYLLEPSVCLCPAKFQLCSGGFHSFCG